VEIDANSTYEEACEVFKEPVIVVSWSQYRAYVKAGMISKEAARDYLTDEEIEDLTKCY
jgi:hypothetical protein